MKKDVYLGFSENSDNNHQSEIYEKSLVEFKNQLDFGYIFIDEYFNSEENLKIIAVQFNEPMGESEKVNFLNKISKDINWEKSTKKINLERTIERTMANKNQDNLFYGEFHNGMLLPEIRFENEVRYINPNMYGLYGGDQIYGTYKTGLLN